jgi:hypothetical protein
MACPNERPYSVLTGRGALGAAGLGNRLLEEMLS